MNFVLDASVALMWLVPQSNPSGVNYAAATLTALRQAQALAPSLFGQEIANVIAKLESKGVVTEADSQHYLSILEKLDIRTDTATATHALGATLNLSRRFKLSAYDAAYLELALRSGLPLATLDANLSRAASELGVVVYLTPNP